MEEIKSTIKEGGAQQLIGQYNIQYITEDSEVVVALDVIRKHISRNAGYSYGIPEYKDVLNIIEEASSLMQTIIDKKEEEKQSYRQQTPGGDSPLSSLLRRTTDINK